MPWQEPTVSTSACRNTICGLVGLGCWSLGQHTPAGLIFAQEYNFGWLKVRGYVVDAFVVKGILAAFFLGVNDLYYCDDVGDSHECDHAVRV